MKKQHRGFLTCLCLASASLTACDGSDESIPIGMWSPVDRSDEATSAAAFARGPSTLIAADLPFVEDWFDMSTRSRPR